MKGRPLVGEEVDRLLAAVAKGRLVNWPGTRGCIFLRGVLGIWSSCLNELLDTSRGTSRRRSSPDFAQGTAAGPLLPGAISRRTRSGRFDPDDAVDGASPNTVPEDQRTG